LENHLQIQVMTVTVMVMALNHRVAVEEGFLRSADRIKIKMIGNLSRGQSMEKCLITRDIMHEKILKQHWLKHPNNASDNIKITEASTFEIILLLALFLGMINN